VTAATSAFNGAVLPYISALRSLAAAVTAVYNLSLDPSANPIFSGLSLISGIGTPLSPTKAWPIAEEIAPATSPSLNALVIPAYTEAAISST